MQVTNEMTEWLNDRSDKLETQGGLIFVNFMNEFNVDKGQAKDLMRTWDAQRRDIPMDKTRKF